MSRFVKIILLLLAASLLTAVPLLMAQEEEPETYSPNSVTGIISSGEQFSTLAEAVAYTNLEGFFAGNRRTLFAPTDEAFAKLGLDAGNIRTAMGRGELRDLLRYHTMRGRLSTADLKTMLGDVTMLNGELAGLKFYEDNVYVNDEAMVVQENIVADNGYIHAVDNVIMPPWPRVEGAAPQIEEAVAEAGAEIEEAAEAVAETITEAAEAAETALVEAVAADEPVIPANSIAGIAIADGRFDTLVSAVVATGLADNLAGGEWTVFAPTDEAFAKLGLTPDNVASAFSEEELTDILLYHVLTESKSTAELKAMLGNVTMANGQIAGLKFYEDNIYVNDDSKVILENIIADNGTIHVVDNVILPPWPRE